MIKWMWLSLIKLAGSMVFIWMDKIGFALIKKVNVPEIVDDFLPINGFFNENYLEVIVYQKHKNGFLPLCIL